ncbi:hypothetical protein SD427_12640 [Chryseobacterium sp. JJR-5R]|uniref:hypothetical protein n=1 Tax=Chryseobacterium sp. JJR-5R TaxID=3093923 RepID=UPI002A752356|nr:hypothetical protein [Chryseobacterium sp. JJR-5R]WPO81611.1 hypothetical protein SD427_12640 [Chryseobacterium sp. JJR-5R]
MIRFIKLLFYHIYLHFYKVDNGNNALAKFTTFLIFTLIFGMIMYFGYVFLCISYSDSIIVHTPYIFYLFLFIIIGGFVGRYVYSKEFENFDSFKDYHKKYYVYFFMIVLFTLSLVIYTGNMSRKRIFKQREMQKEHIEDRKENLKVN